MDTVDSNAPAKVGTASRWSAMLTVLVCMLVATAALLYRMTLGANAPGAPVFTGFEAYLHSRGCVVAQTLNTSVTSYRCDVPVAGAYLSRTQLETDFQQSQSAKP